MPDWEAVVTINKDQIKVAFLIQKNILTQLMAFDTGSLDRVQVNMIVKEAINRTEEQLISGEEYQQATS